MAEFLGWLFQIRSLAIVCGYLRTLDVRFSCSSKVSTGKTIVQSIDLDASGVMLACSLLRPFAICKDECLKSLTTIADALIILRRSKNGSRWLVKRCKSTTFSIRQRAFGGKAIIAVDCRAIKRLQRI